MYVRDQYGNLVFVGRFCSVDGGGDAGGGTGTGTGDGSGEKPKVVFTTEQQELLNSIIKRESDKHEAKLKAERTAREKDREAFDALNTDYTTLKQLLEEAAGDLEGDGAGSGTGNGKDSPFPELEEFERELTIPNGIKDPAAYRAWKKAQFIQGKQLKSAIDALDQQKKDNDETRKMVVEERKLRQEADTARASAIRDTELATALQKNRCVDLEVGVKVLRENVVWDDKQKSFVYRQKDGSIVSIAEGVAAALQKMPFLVEAANGDGGAGSGGGRGAPSDQQIKGLEAKLADAEVRARKSGRPSDVSEYQNLKRQIREAKEQQQKAKGSLGA